MLAIVGFLYTAIAFQVFMILWLDHFSKADRVAMKLNPKESFFFLGSLVWLAAIWPFTLATNKKIDHK